METFSMLSSSAIGTFVFYSEYFSTSIYLALYLVPQYQDGIYKDSIAIPIWCPFPLLFTPFFMSALWIQHKVGVFNLKRSKTRQETPQTTANHLLYRGSKIVYQIKSDADLKFMITFNGIIIFFFPVCSITESFGCTVQQDEIRKGRTLHRQAPRSEKGQWNNARAPLSARRMLPPHARHSLRGWAGLMGPCSTELQECLLPESEISPPTKGGYSEEHWAQTMLAVACKRSGVISIPTWHEPRLLLPLPGKDCSRGIRPLAVYLPKDRSDLCHRHGSCCCA